ncbi:hypothetical protein [Actinoplanes awajinensis]|nr:hypothetical protein [Actinoplanes awajinensis]
MINRRGRRFLTAGVMLAVTAAVLPGRSYGSAQPPVGHTWGCFVVASGPATDPPCPEPIMPSRGPVSPPPRPTGLATDGVPGCVTGPARPVVGTTRPSLSVSFAPDGPQPTEVTVEHESLDGSEEPYQSSAPVEPGKPVVLEADEEGLAPGVSYRWRVTGTSADAAEPGWSPWCEFTVVAGLLDLSAATDLDAVRELGVDPARRYPVTLPVRQWRLLLDALTPPDEGVTLDDEFDDGADVVTERLRGIGAGVRAQIAGRSTGQVATVTLTGDEWASAAMELAMMAGVWDETAEEDPEADEDGATRWAAVDRLSAALGGPAHPGLGHDR